MRQLINFIKKEFAHVFRDRKTLLLLFGMPVAQIVLFGFALTNEIKNSKIVIADFAKDISSQQIIRKIESNTFFSVEKNIMDPEKIGAAFRQGKIKLAVIFPDHFNYDLMHGNKAQIQVIADATDPNTATTLTNYLNAIVGDYQQQLMGETKMPMQIVPEMRMLYNPELKGAPNFVPGVMAMVLLLVCVMMTSISIVKEKEMGTMEILLVSPFNPFMVIISKMVPYLFVSLLNLCIILL
ncbi:MAG: ABC transporter permease, partial [Bacteroidia bacterium]